MEATSTPTTPTESAATLSAGGRDAHLDNLKFVLIVLVVVGHAVSTVRDRPAADLLYTGIYLFHMPAFVFVAGLLTPRSFRSDRGPKLLRSIVVPYVVFQALYLLFERAFAPDPGRLTLLSPFWLMWFLLALGVWRLATPLLLSLRAPLVWAVGASLLVPLLDEVGRTLSLNRVLGMLPFFVAGLVAPRDLLSRMRAQRWAVPVGVAGLIVVALATVIAVRIDVANDTLFYTARYGDGAAAVLRGMVLRTIVLAVGAGATIAVALVLPRSRRWFTAWGVGSIGGYLLHGFPVLALRWSGLDEAVPGHLGVAVLVTGGIVVALVASAPAVVRSLSPLLSPQVGWLTVPSDEDGRRR